MKFATLVFRTCAVMAALMAGAIPGAAQTRATTADLAGTVRDASGGVLPGATVGVTNIETNVARTVTTTNDGRFAAPALPPGRYTVRVELAGFAPQARDDVTLSLGEYIELELTLGLAGVQEQVVATSSPSR